MDQIERFIKVFLDLFEKVVKNVIEWIDTIMERTEGYTFYLIAGVLLLALSRVLTIGVGGRKTTS